MSMPSCIRPQRMPNGLVTGPLTGQMRPCEDGVESPGADEDREGEELCAAWIRAASCELVCWSPSASAMNACFVSRTDARLARSAERARESLWLEASSES